MLHFVLFLGIPVLIKERLLRNRYRTAADLESDNNGALLKFLTLPETHCIYIAVIAAATVSVVCSSAWSRLGNIAEFIGDPRSGQTQLCLRLCIAAQLPAELGGIEMRAVYVDCIGSFSSSDASRAAQSISCCCQQSSHEQLLNGVGVFRVYSAHELMALLVSFENIRSQLNNVGLLVINTISWPFLASFPDNVFRRQAMQAEAASLLTRIASKNSDNSAGTTASISLIKTRYAKPKHYLHSLTAARALVDGRLPWTVMCGAAFLLIALHSAAKMLVPIN
ncbi:DNA repair protein rad51c [Coemansia sp. RSA 1358]|nr:DNA repair protein rad51c [Coemansia sp. RSA 1358]